MMRIGLIADTHGLLRPAALEFLKGCNLVLHAGDVGSPECLSRLKGFAPLYAVRGNVDDGDWARELPPSRIVEAGGIRFHIVHQLETMLPPGVDGSLPCAMFGHTHRPELRMRQGVVLLNPGSIGPRRFNLPISLADVVSENGKATFTTYHLEERSGTWRVSEQVEGLEVRLNS